MSRVYVTTTLPRVDTRPDLAYALEAVRADALARHHRMRGARVRFLSGSTAAYAALREPLALCTNDFVYLAEDARHRTGVTRLWQACASDLRRTDKGWVFRLSATADALVSRPRTGAGIPVPDDPGHEVDDGFSVLAGYVTSLGYGTDGAHHRRWWVEGDERVHVVDSDALPAHTGLWPAVLESAGQPAPTRLLVHDRPTDPTAPDVLAHRHGTDAVRWWLLRDAASPARADRELADVFGSLVDRVVVLVHRYRDGRTPTPVEPTGPGRALVESCRATPERVAAAFTAGDLRAATEVVVDLAGEAERFLRETRPWDAARAERDGDVTAGEHLDAALTVLLRVCRTLADQLTPFVPTLAARVAERAVTLSGVLPLPRAVYPRLPDQRGLA
ncbi:methionine--tRNA ligase [Saccharothrix violaceirubra]|uniref:Methionyl-tRNA synthetase n=1 Tax=Saccharothrix violaceirubra TaxID=413306 RepID=A0A7W7WVV9_9PSEU|nr:class I tRNA ligase family protein [Saccharothrix violaceirubra]MBB4965735.1 methionyl-tRNA synthetase [Saccharothrix violaceirubra]